MVNYYRQYNGNYSCHYRQFWWYITSADVAVALGLSERMARVLLSEWVRHGWIIVFNPSRRARKYALRENIRSYIDGQNR
jgi:hypothetical protein